MYDFLTFLRMRKIFCFLLLYVEVFANPKLDSLVIEISSGKIEGQYIHSPTINKSFYSFRGIPYAEPPLGELRFRPSVPPESWDYVLETKIDGPQCMQIGGGSEDCLFLNVYTPSLPNNEETDELLPVMVFIHGGFFQCGSSNSENYRPNYLIDKNVVLVTLNYRLNIFGFLNAVDESAPGNVGLKDQLLALRWVQENIAKFNGNPDQVTLFGHSAGSGSVAYHIQSKLSKGLFHKAILQSGSTLNYWALEENPIDLIHKLGKVLKTDSKNLPEFINKLRNMSAKELFNASEHESLLDVKNKPSRYRFVPSLEYESPNAFIEENSYTLLEDNKINQVPLIIGHNTNEALIFLVLDNPKIYFDDYEYNPLLLVPISLNILNDIENEKAVVEKLREQYFNNDSIPFNLSFIHSDESMVRGVRKTIEFLRDDNKIYHYIFDYKRRDDGLPGLQHGAELKYIFFSGALDNEERKVKEQMTTLWTNFAKTGNPTPNKDTLLENLIWPPVSKPQEVLQYLYIGKQLEIRNNPWQEYYNFWENIFKTYGKPPFFTY